MCISICILNTKMRQGRGDDMHVIELTIPMSQPVVGPMAQSGPIARLSSPGECHICASTFCKNFTDPCCHVSTHLKCCTQRLCTHCLVKMAKKCTCKLSCNEVIAFCPFCREISGISKEELYRGSRQMCRLCKDTTQEPNERNAPNEADADANANADNAGTNVNNPRSTDAEVQADRPDRSPEVSSRLQGWFT
jgi:hypothetical protein